MLTVYGDTTSGNCLKVRWTAEYLGIPFDWKTISAIKKETRTGSFLAINPAGQIPVVKFADGRILAQSNAIMLHFAETTSSFSDKNSSSLSLIPVDPFARAKMYEWLFWEQYSHEPAIAVRRFHRKYLEKTDDEIDPSLLPKGIAALQRMEDALLLNPWFAGNEFTLADIALVAYTRLAHEGGFDLAPFQNVKNWIGKVEQKLAIKEA
jgi:glutathione S-transferase